MSTAPIRLVCFDLGGVLLRICRSWEEGCRVAGVEYRVEPKTLGSFADGWHELNRAYQAGRLEPRAFHERFSALTGGTYAPEEVERVQDRWIIGEYEGTLDVIASIHDAGLETIALSNSCHEHWETMPAYANVQALGRRVGSHELGLVKPDEAIYRALERTAGVAPASILFFDDRAENVEGARRCGWSAVEIDPLGDTAAQIVAGLEAHDVRTVGSRG